MAPTKGPKKDQRVVKLRFSFWPFVRLCRTFTNICSKIQLFWFLDSRSMKPLKPSYYCQRDAKMIWCHLASKYLNSQVPQCYISRNWNHNVKSCGAKSISTLSIFAGCCKIVQFRSTYVDFGAFLSVLLNFGLVPLVFGLSFWPIFVYLSLSLFSLVYLCLVWSTFVKFGLCYRCIVWSILVDLVNICRVWSICVNFYSWNSF